MKIIMMGTGPFAVPTFEALVPRHEIPLLVTRPTAAVKRGTPPPNPMRASADALGIKVVDPPSVNDEAFVSTLESYAADLFVVCDYGQILSKKCLAAARLGGINLHGSLLPKYRGAAPVNWPIYHGETTTGVSVIHMTPKLDGGPILSSAQTEIGENETAAELEPRLSHIGVACVHEAIEQLEKWNGVDPIGEIQDSSLATPARRLKKSDGAIDWSRSAVEIKNQIRAFDPWPASFTFWHRDNGKTVRVIIHRVTVADFEFPSDAVKPGQVVQSDGKQLIIATGDGCLAIDSIQPSGKRAMEIAEFLRGYPVKIGDLFGSQDG